MNETWGAEGTLLLNAIEDGLTLRRRDCSKFLNL